MYFIVTKIINVIYHEYLYYMSAVCGCEQPLKPELSNIKGFEIFREMTVSQLSRLECFLILTNTEPGLVAAGSWEISTNHN